MNATPLSISTPLHTLPIPPEDVAFFNENGFLTVLNALSDPELQQLQD